MWGVCLMAAGRCVVCVPYAGREVWCVPLDGREVQGVSLKREVQRVVCALRWLRGVPHDS